MSVFSSVVCICIYYALLGVLLSLIIDVFVSWNLLRKLVFIAAVLVWPYILPFMPTISPKGVAYLDESWAEMLPLLLGVAQRVGYLYYVDYFFVQMRSIAAVQVPRQAVDNGGGEAKRRF